MGVECGVIVTVVLRLFRGGGVNEKAAARGPNPTAQTIVFHTWVNKCER
jgi:hypothetical protein